MTSVGGVTVTGLHSFISNAAAELDLTTDPNLNIDDVLGMLPSSSTWDTTLGSTSTNYTTAGTTSPATSQQHAPVTHVSWSNMPSVNMTQAAASMPQPPQPLQQNRRPVPLNVQLQQQQQRGLMAGLKSPISPVYTNQRSPGLGGQISPGFVGQPSPGHTGQRSPASSNPPNLNAMNFPNPRTPTSNVNMMQSKSSSKPILHQSSIYYCSYSKCLQISSHS